MFVQRFDVHRFVSFLDFAIILKGKKNALKLVALLRLSSWCLVVFIVLWLFLTVP